MIILNLRIGFLKIKSEKIRFINYSEAKRNGNGSLLQTRQLRSIQGEDEVSCFVGSVTSKQASRFNSTVNHIPIDTRSHKRTASHFTSHSDRYKSPLMKTEPAENHLHNTSVDVISDIAKKLTAIKETTNRPVHLNGTPILNEKFCKRMFFGKTSQNEKDIFQHNIAMIGQRAELK